MKGIRKGTRGVRASLGALSAIAMVVALLSGCGGTSTGHSASGTTKPANAGTPQYGGTMTFLENTGGIGGWPDGLDPATDRCCAIEDEPYMDAIYGQLFTQGPKGQPEPDLATGYKFLDGAKTVEIYLRHGVTFTDGTPFNAEAVKWNFDRDLQKENEGATLFSSFPVASTTTQGDYTVIVHLAKPFAPLIDGLITVAMSNWIASPTAVEKMGAKEFALKPVGAGPFMVVSDNVNAQLVLKRNPNYWQKGRPYLDGVVYKVVGADNSAYSALETGQAQVAQQVQTLSVVQTAQKNPQMRVVVTPGSGTGALQLNTAIPPFNNIKAREAVYYSLDPQALNKVVAGGAGAVSQTGDGPASLFPTMKVNNYRTYNLAKAKELVKELGGLSFTITGFAPAMQLTEAEQSEFAAAGMKTQINTVNLAQLVKAFETNSWQITGGGAGGLDPGVGVPGMTWRVESDAPFTGIHDKYLDQLIDEGAATTDHAARAKIYQTIFQYMSDKALMPFLYANPLYNISTLNVFGPGISTPLFNNYLIQWPDIWMKKK